VIKLGIVLAAGAALLLAAPSARAADFTPSFAASRAGGFIDLWPFQDGTAGMFGAELQLGLTRRVFLDMSFTGAFAGASIADGSSSNVGYGNPTIGAHYAGQATSRLSFFVGGAFTVPLLADPDSDVAFAARYTAPIRGWYDADRLTPAHFALRAAGGLEWAATNHAYFRAELRPVLYVPLRREYAVFEAYNHQGESIFALEQAVELEGRFSNGLGFGGRLQAVVKPGVNDQFQALFEPFMMLSPRRGRGLYLRLGFPIALDEELGFGTDRNKLATGRFAIGGQW